MSWDSWADRLTSGEMIGSYHQHHKGMERLLGLEGRPRPFGLTLSLIRCDGPASYWGNWTILWDNPYRRRLSYDPEDYDWETNIDNLRRNPEDNRIYLEKGLVSFSQGIRTYHGPLEDVPTLEEWAARGGTKRRMLVAKYYQKIERKMNVGV